MQYQLEELKNQCLDHLLDSMTDEMVCEGLFIAEMHNCSTLKGHCLEYIHDHKTAVKQTEGWEMLQDSGPDLIDQIDDANKSKKKKKK